jgi:hypothetical protein
MVRGPTDTPPIDTPLIDTPPTDSPPMDTPPDGRAGRVGAEAGR